MPHGPLAPESPYNLIPAGNAQAEFHAVLQEFASKVEITGEAMLADYVDGHMALQHLKDSGSLRSRGEYLVELLTLGILREEYRTHALVSTASQVRRLRRLWLLRSGRTQRKDFADMQRAQIFFQIQKAVLKNEETQDVSDVALCDWLMATGEFTQEVLRIQEWINECGVFWNKGELELVTSNFASWFRQESDSALGDFTLGVKNHFAKWSHANEIREDLFLIMRAESLYHLNMVGAELMNRGFKSGFATRPKKILLVPGCMRFHQGSACRAKQTGLDIQCQRCTPHCEVMSLDQMGEKEGFSVFIIPHASTFSAWLQHWTHDPKAALIACACPLHLVPGGYEMRALGLQAQCILLQYSGCRRHWSREGVATRIDRNQLRRVLCGDAK